MNQNIQEEPKPILLKTLKCCPGWEWLPYENLLCDYCSKISEMKTVMISSFNPLMKVLKDTFSEENYT